MWKSNVSKDIRNMKASRLILPSLFHLSFSGGLQGTWIPRPPASDEDSGERVEVPDEEKFPYPEPSIARISLSGSIEGCFIGIFPNVAKFFEKDNLPHMNLYVYSPIFKGEERVVPPTVLTKDRIVWDAVATQEYCVLDKVDMVLIGMIKVMNTNREKTRYIHPFGDRSLPLESVGPEKIKFEWVEGPFPIPIPTKSKNSLSQFR